MFIGGRKTCDYWKQKTTALLDKAEQRIDAYGIHRQSGLPRNRRKERQQRRLLRHAEACRRQVMRLLRQQHAQRQI